MTHTFLHCTFNTLILRLGLRSLQRLLLGESTKTGKNIYRWWW